MDSAFGLLGFVLVQCGCEPAPLLLGFVLGTLLEENLRRAMLISLGDPTTFIIRPISAGLLAAGAVALLVDVLLALLKSARRPHRRGLMTTPPISRTPSSPS